VIELGIDAYCWHARLAAGEITIGEIIDATASLGVTYLQTELDYVRDHGGGIDAASDKAAAAGLRLEANGGPIGRPYFDSNAEAASAAVEQWLRESEQLGSSGLVIHSGVYLPELEAVPGSKADELTFIREVLHRSLPTAEEAGVQMMFENASDFRSDELIALIEGESRYLRIFLDLTNPYNVFEDPIEAVGRLAPLAAAGHVKDFVLTSNWTPDKFHRRGYSVEFRYPGEGVTKVAEAISKLVESTPLDPFPLSIEGLDSEAGVDDQVPRLDASLRSLRTMIADAQGGHGGGASQ
jgi:sugar phosphate isomerase/epimerase